MWANSQLKVILQSVSQGTASPGICIVLICFGPCDSSGFGVSSNSDAAAGLVLFCKEYVYY